ncbi:DNA-binding response regulator [Rathayibacter soli]|uniref:DNA-binding response regulator n=1 Tax=Rathayibacter soli TaxID=3144168 RepID=UPI0027E4558C|nr:response regulator [Glaciibacter superstes]
MTWIDHERETSASVSASVPPPAPVLARAPVPPPAQAHVPVSVPPPSGSVRVALLDDHELLLDSLSTWIRMNEPQFELVLAVGTWVEMVHSPAFPTDLVLMDLQLKERISIEARVRTCRAAGAVVIVLTALDTVEDRERSLQAGAAAYLTKSQSAREVMAVARTAMGLPRVVASQADTVGEGGVRENAVIRPHLSRAEVIALGLYVAGHTTVEVASGMNVGYETAKTFLRRIRDKYAKAGRPTSTREDMIRRAAEDGYLT